MVSKDLEDNAPAMENQEEKTVENEMETGCTSLQGHFGIPNPQKEDPVTIICNIPIS